MIIDLEIIVPSRGPLAVRTAAGTFPVLTVSAAARRLRRSRRQVYRLVKAGVLTLRAKALGECLLDEAGVRRLEAAPRLRQRLPASLAVLFPDYDLAALNAGGDRDLVLTRVLDGGGERAAAWALRRYGAPAAAAFVRRRGAALRPRSRAFWEAFFGVRAEPAPAWRAEGPWRA